MRTLWVFQVFDPLTEDQAERIAQMTGQFLDAWKAHGTPVPADYEIRHKRFLIIRAAEDAASGCSVDRMYRETLAILEKCGASVAGPENVFYKNGSEHPKYFHFQESADLISAGKIGPDTLIYNSAISQADELANFEAPLKDTWLSRFIPETHA